MSEVHDRHKEMWAKIRRHLKLKPNQDWPDWLTCAKAARELGYEDYARAWESSLVGRSGR